MKKLSAGMVVAVILLAGCGEIFDSPGVRDNEEKTRGGQRRSRGPLEGRDWTSPSTGMEFTWIPQVSMWVGKREVTNAEYRKKEPAHDSSSFEGRTLNLDRQPAVLVNFEDAKAYAAWLTGEDKLPRGAVYRLPTEREWMAYARCGDEREYPWGNNWPPVSGQAGNYADESAGKSLKAFTEDIVIQGYKDGFAVTAPVDELWVNPWGLAGVGGNVWEACARDGDPSSFGAWRGGSWNVPRQEWLRCSFRRWGGGSTRVLNYGFRLVLSR